METTQCNKNEENPESPNSMLEKYFNDIASYELLDENDEFELHALIHAGNTDAKEKMINGNLRLVIKIAKDYPCIGSMSFADLVSEGNLGLMKAVERFDPSKGKFSTYAGWWIRQSIRRAIGNFSRVVRLPIHLQDKISHVRNVCISLYEELGREPTDEEVSEATGISVTKVRLYIDNSKGCLSLCDSSDEENYTLEERLKDENCDCPFTKLQKKCDMEFLTEAINSLPEREQIIIKSRFGMGCEEKTLEELGNIIGLTRERIRQIEGEVLQKLREAIEIFNVQKTNEETVDKSL